jgi:hypothetical protein
MKMKLLPALTGATLNVFLLYVPPVISGELNTMIDLSYTYEQEHLGNSITSETDFEQKYEMEYTSSLTAIYDMRIGARLDVGDQSGDDIAKTTNLSPTLELEIVGSMVQMRASYDGTRDTTEKTHDSAETESFSSNYLFEIEITPDYWPEMKLKVERSRDFEESQEEKVDKTVELSLRKDIYELALEFDLDYGKTETTMPVSSESREISWEARAAYQDVVWWDVDVDLAYEIQEQFSEDFERGVFVDESKEYTHNFDFRLGKTLDFTPRITGDFEYEYQFEQDLLLLDFDYNTSQRIAFDLAWKLAEWLQADLQGERLYEYTRNRPPEEKEESLQDSIAVGFSGELPGQIEFAGLTFGHVEFEGQAEWEKDKDVPTGSGGTVNTDETGRYELSVRHNWGDWWDLVVTGGNEYTYENDWLTSKEASLKADLALTFYRDFIIGSTYEITRMVDYGFNEPLELSQTRDEDFQLSFGYTRDFGSFIQFGFANDFGIQRGKEIDEVLNFVETVEISEDTQIRLALVDFIRDMLLEGEITRKATDTKDDEEPMLVDITYALKWDWIVQDINLSATYEYDDNGDTFDSSSFNTKVAWSRDNVDISGEYQFDKTYSDEIDEQRKLNLSMSVVF